jgi:pyruvate kinase
MQEINLPTPADLTPELESSYPHVFDAQYLHTKLTSLRDHVREQGGETFARWRPGIERRGFIAGALNLAQYLTFRSHDLRVIQTALMPWGLSSIGRAESRVMPTLDAVIASLGLIAGVEGGKYPTVREFFRGERQLRQNTAALLGGASEGGRVRIMVTMPSEAATNYRLLHDLLAAGMNIIRINCAHDTPKEWEAMIANLRRAEALTGASCKIFMDLGGPKVRTGEVLLPKKEKKARLQAGAKLFLARDKFVDADEYPFQALCQLPEVFDQVSAGQRVWFDDGELGTEVMEILPEGLALKVIQTDPKGYKLKPEKGINFPDTDLRLRALTAKDIQDLDFVAQYADIIGYSFVQEVPDLEILQAELAKRLGAKASKMGVVAKIETPLAVRNLPELIAAAAAKNPFGIMIARGDLAVEIGYDRLAEIQEEILWLCEAAYIPVIWATQVLESLVKTGIPSRSEMTDAAMSHRAECVMLNKGEFVVQAVRVLDNLLSRMQEHNNKKTPQLRALKLWQR